MSEAKFNPMSPQYRGEYGEDVPTCGLLVYERPSLEWQMAHPDAEQTGEKAGPDDIEVRIMLTIRRAVPSALDPGNPAKWPLSEIVPLGPVLFMQGDQAIPAVMTLTNFRRLTPIKGAASETAKETDAPVS